MALAFDAVGPSSAGATAAASTTLTFAHTITGASTVLIAGIAVDAGSDAGMTCACTYNGAAMTTLGSPRHSGGGTAGFLQVFGIIAAAGGPFNVVATVSGGTPANITGGSLSFTGAGQTLAAAFGTPAASDSAGTTPTTATGTLASNTSGNIIAGFLCQGAGITSATAPSTSRFNNSRTGTGAAGSCGGATSPATGSPVTMAWTVSPDWYAEILVEVLAAAAGTDSGPNSPSTGTDLGGGTGSWTSPGNITADDGSAATWAVV